MKILIRWMSKLTVAAIALIVLGRCATAPMKLQTTREGHWQAKVLVKDKDAGKSFIVNLNINAIKSEQLRIDVTAALGNHVASLYSDDKEVKYLMVEQKRFYFGKPSPDVLRPIFAVPIDPRWLHNILFEEPLTEKGWTCDMDATGFVKLCKEARGGLVIRWTERHGRRRTVVVEHPRANMQINFVDYEAKVESRDKLFVLEAPASFKKFQIR